MAEPRHYPALDLRWNDRPDDDAADILIAAIDHLSPSAVETFETGIRIFFTNPADRDRALKLVRQAYPHLDTNSLSVSDESWAERNQAALTPVRVGAIVVAPPWADVSQDTSSTVVRIQPSMGFGTGHHASTRLCLKLLQDVALPGRSLIDIGTGSGVLAIAAWRLGAGPVVAIDLDEDALTSARENLDLNDATRAIELRNVDISTATDFPLRRFDVVTANLTGALLARASEAISRCLTREGSLLASGIQEHEIGMVLDAFARRGLASGAQIVEDGWAGIRLQRTEK